jgi:hypothetical protein
MLDHTRCVFSANMRRASLDAICEASEIASRHQSADLADEVSHGVGCSPSLLAGSLGCCFEGVGDRSGAAREDLEELEGLSEEWLSALGRGGKEGNILSKEALESGRPSWASSAILPWDHLPLGSPGQRAITKGSESYEPQVSLGEASRGFDRRRTVSGRNGVFPR